MTIALSIRVALPSIRRNRTFKLFQNPVLPEKRQGLAI